MQGFKSESKHFSMKTAPRTKENQEIATTILKIVADYDKRVGAYKITHILERDYGIWEDLSRT